jgi:uncharacterized protein (UPF0332 family)
VSESLKALVKFRLEQADESLESSQILLERQKYRPSVSRSYYAMFYAVLALLAKGEKNTSKHSGIISIFDQKFVKKGVFDKNFSRWFHEAFELRQRADYREMFTVSHDRAISVLEHAASFVAAIKEHIENNLFK